MFSARDGDCMAPIGPGHSLAKLPETLPDVAHQMSVCIFAIHEAVIGWHVNVRKGWKTDSSAGYKLQPDLLSTETWESLLVRPASSAVVMPRDASGVKIRAPPRGVQERPNATRGA